MKADNLFCLFVHIGRILPKKADILVMPLGLPMLCGVLEDAGFRSRVFNDTLSALCQGDNLDTLICRFKPALLAFSLHWYQQLPYVYEKIKHIREKFPNLKILAGGFTASYFAKELISLSFGPDFIICGDAELPILALAKKIAQAENDYSDVPNLVWKKPPVKSGKPRPIFNPQSYISGSEKLSALKYARYDLVLNKGPVMRGDFSVELSAKGCPIWEMPKYKTVFYNPGRGCPFTCSFCGGSCAAQLRINGRAGYFFKTISSALNDWQGFACQGFEIVHTCYDPDPFYKWSLNFFEKLRERKIKLAHIFEAWGLPTHEFMDAFALTFGHVLEKSRIIISPETASESVRRRNKGLFYTNSALEDSIAYAAKLKIPLELCFASSLPGESAKDFLESIKMVNYYTKAYNLEANMSPIPLEPGAPMYENPQSWGIKTNNFGFKSFLANKTNIIDWEHINRPWGTVAKRSIYFNAKKSSRK